MVQVKSKLSKKDKQIVSCSLNTISDSYNDFYITEDNLRLFLKDNSYLLFNCLNKGDKIAFEENGMAIITGFSDKATRKYIKVLAKDEHCAYNLIKVLVEWTHNNIDLYAKIKKNNPLIEVLKKVGFKFKGNRGKEILLCKEGKKE